MSPYVLVSLLDDNNESCKYSTKKLTVGEFKLDRSIIKKIDNNVSKIREHLSNPDGYPSFKKLFSTDLGNQLGYQANELFDFVRKSSLIAISFSRAPSSVVLAEALGEDLNENLDLNWLRTLSAFSLYTYLDVYSRNVIKWIDRNTVMRNRLTEHLIEYSKTRSDKSRLPITDAKEMRKLSVKNRLVQIEKGLLSNAIDGVAMDDHRTSWSKFIEFRNKAAHHDPRVELPQETLRRLKKSLGEPEYDFGSPAFKFQKETINRTKGFQKVCAVFTQALLYPAYVDAGLDALLND
jgi:hypothetical protein